jgi:hypothetical protein
VLFSCGRSNAFLEMGKVKLEENAKKISKLSTRWGMNRRYLVNQLRHSFDFREEERNAGRPLVKDSGGRLWGSEFDDAVRQGTGRERMT